MKRFYLLASLVAVLIIFVAITGQRVFSQLDDTPEATTDTSEISEQEEVPTPLLEEATIGPITVEGSMPEPEEGPTVEIPTAVPLPSAPQPAPALADEQVLYLSNFDDSTLTDWKFTHTGDVRLPVEEWVVNDGQLVSPENLDWFEDTLALPPVQLAGDGSIEVSGLTAGSASNLGLVLGYQDNQNYTALIFYTAYAPDPKGLTLVQVVNGTATVVAQDANLALEPNTWYQLRCDRAGSVLSVSVNGNPTLTANLPQPLAGEGVGLYAGKEGYAFFDNLRILGK